MTGTGTLFKLHGVRLVWAVPRSSGVLPTSYMYIDSRTARRRDHWGSQNYAGERNKILRQHMVPKLASSVPSKNREPGSGTILRFPVPLKSKVAYETMNWPFPMSISWKVPIPVPLETKLAISGQASCNLGRAQTRILSDDPFYSARSSAIRDQ